MRAGACWWFLKAATGGVALLPTPGGQQIQGVSHSGLFLPERLYRAVSAEAAPGFVVTRNSW